MSEVLLTAIIAGVATSVSAVFGFMANRLTKAVEAVERRMRRLEEKIDRIADLQSDMRERLARLEERGPSQRPTDIHN